MPLMTWTDKLSVGIKAIDDDHKKLVSMVNELYGGIVAGHGKETLGKVLDELVNYTKFHFAREEGFFAKTGYPAAAAHKKEHDDLTKQVLDVQAKYKSGALATLSLEVMNFLKNWLVNHIQGSDQKYAPHLNAKGIH
ncbi:MAG: bacteriohemerythrin [Acidobacteriales bacterium]|nr:bacteriohemerythrin [Terriglobales bacterium]